MADDVGVAIIVNDHVHLGHPGKFVVHFDAKEIPLRKVVPELEVLYCPGLFLPVSFAAHMVERVEQEASRATRRIKHQLLSLRIEDLDRECDQFARRKVLTEVAFEESSHEFLKGHALGIEFGSLERDTLQMLDAQREDGWIDVDLVRKDIRLSLLLRIVEAANTGGKLRRCFTIAALKRVRLAVFAFRVFLVAVLDEDDLAELTERCDGAAASTFPKGLMALTNGSAQFFAGHCGQVLPWLVLVEAPLRRFSIALGDVGEVVLIAFARRVSIEAQEAASEAGNGTAEVRPEAGAVTANLFYRLGELRVTNIGPLALKYEVRGLPLRVAVNDDIGVVVRRAPRNVHLEGNALRRVFVLVDEFRPELGADFLLWVRPTLRVVSCPVADALILSFACDFCIPVCKGTFDESGLCFVSHVDDFCGGNNCSLPPGWYASF